MAQHMIMKYGKIRTEILDMMDEYFDGKSVSGMEVKRADYEERTGKKHWKGQAYIIYVSRKNFSNSVNKTLDKIIGEKWNSFSFEMIIDSKTIVYLVA